jgi:hypothetical protein
VRIGTVKEGSSRRGEERAVQRAKDPFGKPHASGQKKAEESERELERQRVCSSESPANLRPFGGPAKEYAALSAFVLRVLWVMSVTAATFGGTTRCQALC